MNIKKRLKRFFTLTRRPNGGFTLVELIVVIAILAILAGVGTAGYSGYVENANKNKDRTLVGNMLRAIETGVKSSAYPLQVALQPGEEGIQIPVGFVVLTENGVTVLENDSEIVVKTPDQQACVSGTVDVYQVVDATTIVSTTKALYKSTVTYCKTHSNLPDTDRVYSTGAQIKAQYNVSSMKMANKIGSSYTPGLSSVQDGTSYLMQGTYRLVEYNDAHVRKAQTSTTHEYVVTSPTQNDESGSMYQMLASALGGEFSTHNKLAYTWKSSAMSSFTANAQTLWNKVETLANQLHNGVDSNGKALGQQVISRGYSSVDEMAIAIPTWIVGKFDTKDGIQLNADEAAENFYLNGWKPLDDSDENSDYWDTWGFTLDIGVTAGREFYCTARVAYNEAFAGYLEEHFMDHGEHDSKHVQNIRDYGADLAESLHISIGQKLPKGVCRGAFNNDNLNGNCTQCRAVYEDYIKDGTSRLNAIEFYKAMLTVKENAQEANNSPFGVMGYYGNYMEQIQALYRSAAAVADNNESVVVISVYYDGVNFDAQVLPEEANPRKN